MGYSPVTLEDLAGFDARWGAAPDGSRADAIVDRLGEPLARAWLRPEVVAAAEAHVAELHGLPRPSATKPVAAVSGRGRCQLLMVTRNGHELTILRPAFVLPVEWRRPEDFGRSSARLPQGLANFAEGVLRDVGVAGLSLHLPEEFERAGVDLSGLAFGLESAWAALAAGAIIFDHKGTVDSSVMATAAWRWDSARKETGRIARVEGVPHKLMAATEAGARIVFAPPGNEGDVERWRSDGGGDLDIRWLSNDVTAPRKAIGSLLAALEVPPSRAAGDSFADRCGYHRRMPQQAADDYYCLEVLDEACERLREQVSHDLNVRRLAFIASESRAVPLLLARLFDPDDVLVFHDGGIGTQKIDRLVHEIAAIGRRADGVSSRVRRSVRLACCSKDRLADDVATHMQTFEAATQGPLLVDLTPGYRAFNLALLEAAPVDAVKAFVHSPQERGRTRAGEEELRIVRLQTAARSSVTV